MSSKTFPLKLTGTSRFQEALAGCREGEPVLVWHEQGNPHDDRALIVTTERGQAIGYVPRDSFLQRALIDEGKGCEATILALPSGGRPAVTGAVIEVELLMKGDRPIGIKAFRR